MGLFKKLFGTDENDVPEVLDEDEYEEALSDSELYVDDVPLEDKQFSLTLRDLRKFDTDSWLESCEELPYDFRLYLDTRRAFSRAFGNMCQEMTYDDYSGGKTAQAEDEYDYDDNTINISFTLSRADNGAPFIFSADIKVNTPEEI